MEEHRETSPTNRRVRHPARKATDSRYGTTSNQSPPEPSTTETAGNTNRKPVFHAVFTGFQEEFKVGIKCIIQTPDSIVADQLAIITHPNWDGPQLAQLDNIELVETSGGEGL